MTEITIGQTTTADRPAPKGAWIVPSVDDVRQILVRPEDQTTVHVSQSCVCDRYAFRGVPARSVDVCVDRRILSHERDDWPLLVAVAQKTGKYDHSVRDRWLVRRLNRGGLGSMRHLGPVPDAELMITATTESIGIRILVDDAVALRVDYRRLPPIDAGYDQIACIKRNWTRYYRHLAWDDDVEPRLDQYQPMQVADGDTISELNMHASRWLADISYELGWSRVIAPAAVRRGLPLWHRDDTPDEQRAAELEAVQDRMERS